MPGPRESCHEANPSRPLSPARGLRHGAHADRGRAQALRRRPQRRGARAAAESLARGPREQRAAHRVLPHARRSSLRSGCRRPSRCASRSASTPPRRSTGACCRTTRRTRAPPRDSPRSRPTGATPPLAAQAEQLVRAGKFREAQDVLRPVLTENPQQREARRLQRVIDDKLVPPVIVSAAAQAGEPEADLDRAARRHPAQHLRDAAARHRHQLHLRPRRALRPAHHHPAARRAASRTRSAWCCSPARSSRRC